VLTKLSVEFGRLLGKAREEAEMTQAELARRLHLKRTSISNIECGRQRPTLELLYGAALVLGKSPADLLPDPAGVDFKGRSELPVNIATDDRLTERDRDKVLEFAARYTRLKD
jgi:transcriptional regulator with XRE-family HTH domain